MAQFATALQHLEAALTAFDVTSEIVEAPSLVAVLLFPDSEKLPTNKDVFSKGLDLLRAP